MRHFDAFYGRLSMRTQKIFAASRRPRPKEINFGVGGGAPRKLVFFADFGEYVRNNSHESVFNMTWSYVRTNSHESVFNMTWSYVRTNSHESVFNMTWSYAALTAMSTCSMTWSLHWHWCRTLNFG
jgi:hypothetical protein